MVKTKPKKINNKKFKLQKAFENNIKISNLNLQNKFKSFEQWEYEKSKRLLYETTLSTKTKYYIYPRGSLVRVDFGVNVGSEFSQQHFAITLTKKDKAHSSVIIVVPLTTKKHINTINIGKVIVDDYFIKLREEKKLIYKKIKETNAKNFKLINKYKQDIVDINEILNHYKNIKNNCSYVCVEHIRTISKLNIMQPINKYDIVNNYTVSSDVMNDIDKNIVNLYTAIDYNDIKSLNNKKSD